MPERTLFERNLLALTLYNPQIAQQLSRMEQKSDSPRVSFIRSKTGQLVPALGDEGASLPLHSTFNPEREGERFKELYSGDGFLLFLGMGACFHIMPFLSLPNVSSILIVDESIALFKQVLEQIDLHHVFLDPRVKILIDKSENEIEAYLLANYIPALLGDLKSIPLWPRFNFAKKYFKEVLKAVESTINKIADDYTVQAKFGKKWFGNTIFNLGVAGETSTTISPQKKVMVTGAGPSLEDCIPEIKARRSDHFLIASDTSLPCLLAFDCEPDCVISIDCQQISYHHFMSGYPRRVPLLLDLASPPVLTRMTDKLIFFSSGHPFSQFVNQNWRSFPFIDTSGGNVSHAAVSLASKLGAREIVLFGVDFSYPEGKTYARGTYLYRYFLSRQDRYEGMESSFFTLIFKNRTVIRESFSGYLRYTTKPLVSYKERMEALFGSIDARIDHYRVKGIDLEIPERTNREAGRINQLFCAGPAESSAHEFLFRYRDSLSRLSEPYNPVVNYLHELPKEERDLWTTLFPALAPLRFESRGDALDGAELLRRARHYALVRLEALLKP